MVRANGTPLQVNRVNVDEPEPAILQKFPYPFEAAFTVASDIDSASPARFRGVHALFCGDSVVKDGSPEWNALGLSNQSRFYSKNEKGIRGLGLTLADSFFLVGDATTFGMYRASTAGAGFTEDKHDNENCDELVRDALRRGQIDSFHAFLHYQRTGIEPLLREFYSWCEREQVDKPRVWINHSAGVTPTGLCPNELQPNRFHRLARWSARRTLGPLTGRKPLPFRQAFMRYDGDTPGSPYYVNDLLSANGLRYVWLNMGGDLHANRAALPEHCINGRSSVLQPVKMDDGVRYYRFERCYGRAADSQGEGAYLRDSREGCDASSLIDERNLRELCQTGGTCILYTHWTHHRSMPVSDETISRFELLRSWNQSGKIWIAPLSQILEWTRRRTCLDFRCSRQGKTLLIEISGVRDPLFGQESLDLKKLGGFCFRMPTELEVSIVASGQLLSTEQVGRSGGLVWIKSTTVSRENRSAVPQMAEA